MTLGTANVLVDRLWSPPTARHRAAVRAVALVVGFALLTAALAQFELKLSFTPVPITGQTLGVLLAGGALGWRLGAASQLLYWVFGLVGLPFYAGGAGGWTNGTGATMGYLVGFVVAAGAIGYLAERKGSQSGELMVGDGVGLDHHLRLWSWLAGPQAQRSCRHRRYQRLDPRSDTVPDR